MAYALAGSAQSAMSRYSVFSNDYDDARWVGLLVIWSMALPDRTVFGGMRGGSELAVEILSAVAGLLCRSTAIALF